MLVLKRKEGQWVEIIHRSGDVMRIRVYDIQSARDGTPNRANLAFEDPERNFEIRRPERKTLAPRPTTDADDVANALHRLGAPLVEIPEAHDDDDTDRLGPDDFVGS
jgi:hypothetical protein